MSILWCGGEDIDFRDVLSFDTTAGHFRSGYSRGGIVLGPSYSARSNAFPGGSITTAWLSCQMYVNLQGTNNGQTRECCIGFVDYATGSGIFIGSNGYNNPTQIGLIKYDASTSTQTYIVGQIGTSIYASGIYKLDMQLLNYGTGSVSVNIFVNNNLVISWTGTLALTGVSAFNCVQVGPFSTNGLYAVSEIIVASEDTRSMGLFTMAPVAAGGTDAWTGAVTTINGITYSDTSPDYTNTTALDQQMTLTTPPAGVYQVKAMKIAARAAASVGATTPNIKLGFNQGGTAAVGAAIAAANAFQTVEQYDTTNPVSTNPWLQSDLTGLQLDMRSST